MMLDRIKAKRDAIDEEIALHKAVINNLIDKREVYNEIIKEEEALVEYAKDCEKTSFDSNEIDE